MKSEGNLEEEDCMASIKINLHIIISGCLEDEKYKNDSNGADDSEYGKEKGTP